MRLGYLLTVLLLGAPAPAAGTSPLAPLPDAQWTPGAAAHLLRRAGFGGTPAEIRALHRLGLAAAVDSLLDWEGKPDPRVPKINIAVTSRPGREQYRMATTREARQQIRRGYTRRDRMQYAVIREWWMQRMIRTDHPLRERMVLFWHGLFTSGYRDVRNSYHMFMQNTLLRRHAAGSFRDLLHEISKDPAMLEYLDNRQNRRGSPNENYAREVMELFTLGEGHYTEKDVKEAARALTGWTFVGNTFRFDRRQHDSGQKTILGKTARFDGDMFLDQLLAQPAASRHLAARLYRSFAQKHADKLVVEGLARTLRDHDWQLRPVLRQLLMSRAFYSPYARGTRVKSPVEFIVGTYRALGMDSTGQAGLSVLAGSLGQELFDPPNVKGWPGGRSWITTSHLLNRYNIAGALVGETQDKLRARDRGGNSMRMMRQYERMQRMDPNGDDRDEFASLDMGGGVAPAPRRGRRATATAFDVLAVVNRERLDTPEQIVAYFTEALLVHAPDDRMRRTLLDYLTRNGFDLARPVDARQKLHGLLRLIVSTPEFQLT